ncbi:gliding motility protein GldL [Taibaiella lutea]|uniref:Gliding motility protein GldL n=1 Tax=Taibaiella lutea TaxID=2608001 RepID=A0A5M6CDH3_9BACT|nr:gliding motility protein GldL [Taibaiella lutea]KAA5533224.1 gliding motility protein GldL [Taibaiella lutea]
MGSISLFFETKQGKYLKNLIIGVGAGVVLLGALFKLQHWPGAGLMLTVGMCTEAFIFCLLGILPPHKDYYWERYYPNLDENPHVEAYKKGVKFTPPTAAIGSSASSSNTTAHMDKMLEEANLNPANLKRLSDNFQSFNTTVNQMKDITDVTAATGSYSQSAREAADALGQMKDTFIGATSTMQSFNNAADSTAQFHDQVQVLSRNLGSLNQIYEVELQDANNHLKAMNKFYSNLVNASDAMASSATDAVNAKEQIAMLSKNLTQLNSIYGNMLSAMQGR